jgi:hypothetical protein
MSLPLNPGYVLTSDVQIGAEMRSGVGEWLNALLRGVDQLGDRWADVRTERIAGIAARQVRGSGELQPAGLGTEKR